MRPIFSAILFLFPASLFAQHGYAPSGTYPADYLMTTYTGKLTMFNPQTHEMKLECDICANHEVFEAILGDPQASRVPKFKVSPRDQFKRKHYEEVRKPAPTSIAIGDLLRVYYNVRKSEQSGTKVNYNAVFDMEKLAAAPPRPETAQ